MLLDGYSRLMAADDLLGLFSLAALDTKLLLDIFYTAKKVVKFELSFLPQTRDILTHISEILPCFGCKGREFLTECRELL